MPELLMHDLDRAGRDPLDPRPRMELEEVTCLVRALRDRSMTTSLWIYPYLMCNPHRALRDV